MSSGIWKEISLVAWSSRLGTTKIRREHAADRPVKLHLEVPVENHDGAGSVEFHVWDGDTKVASAACALPLARGWDGERLRRTLVVRHLRDTF